MELQPKQFDLDLYHRTSAENAERIRKTGVFTSQENTGEAYFSTHPHGQAEGYGEGLVHIRVPEHVAELDDEFPDGEQHYRVHPRNIRRQHIVED